jgi:hypothetical protein
MASSTADRALRPAAAILAWVFPGLGHISLGERKRGGLIMFGVLFLFLGGLLIGGVDVVDRRRDHLWFYAQMFCGPLAFAADFANQTLVARPPESWRGDPTWRQRYGARDPEVLGQLHGTSLAKVNEIGTLFVALAGLMNLVVMLDALHRPAPPAPREAAAR